MTATGSPVRGVLPGPPPVLARWPARAADEAPGLLDQCCVAVTRRAAEGWQHAELADAALRALAVDRGADVLLAPLREVGRTFGLGATDLGVLEVAVAAEAGVAAHLLLGLLSGDDRPGRPTVAVALELAGSVVDLAGAHRLLGPSAPLVRSGLVRVVGEDVLLSRRVVLSERVGAWLAGDGAPPAAVLSALVDAVPVAVEGTDLLVAALEAGHPLVRVDAQGGGAGTALGAAACQRLAVPCLVADLARADPALPVQEVLVALLLEAGLRGAVLVLSAAERVRPEGLLDAPVPVCAVTTGPWDTTGLAHLPPVVPAPRLTAAQRQALWEPVVGECATSGEVAALPLSPEQIVAAARHAAAAAALHGDGAVTVDRVRASVRALGRGSPQRAPRPATRLEDLVLPAAAAAEVRRLLDWARHRDEVVALGSLHGKGGKGVGIAALFSGSPGTGKTLAAHVVADSLGLDLHQVDLSAVVDKYVGETEKNLERVFAEAEALNAVLFFDEADALFGARSSVSDARDRYANQEIAYLLQRMEQFDGITVLATNLSGNLDAAFARRLHFVIAFPDPDEPTRRRLWQHHLAGLAQDPDDEVDLDWLASEVQLAGGDIRNTVLAAVHAAVAERVPLGMRHVDDAVRREHAKLGRFPPGKRPTERAPA